MPCLGMWLRGSLASDGEYTVCGWGLCHVQSLDLVSTSCSVSLAAPSLTDELTAGQSRSSKDNIFSHNIIFKCNSHFLSSSSSSLEPPPPQQHLQCEECVQVKGDVRCQTCGNIFCSPCFQQVGGREGGKEGGRDEGGSLIPRPLPPSEGRSGD